MLLLFEVLSCIHSSWRWLLRKARLLFLLAAALSLTHHLGCAAGSPRVQEAEAVPAAKAEPEPPVPPLKERVEAHYNWVVKWTNVLTFASIIAGLASVFALRFIPGFPNGRITWVCLSCAAVALSLKTFLVLAGPIGSVVAMVLPGCALALASVPHLRFMITHFRKDLNHET